MENIKLIFKVTNEKFTLFSQIKCTSLYYIIIVIFMQKKRNIEQISFVCPWLRFVFHPSLNHQLIAPDPDGIVDIKDFCSCCCDGGDAGVSV